MRTFKLRRLAVVLVALGLVAAACGDDSGTSSSTTGGGDSSAPAAEFETISSGKLTVCSDAPYEPFEFQADDGTWTGFDMDLMREIASNLGLELAVTVQPFDGIWLAPAAGTCDLVASAMTIKPDRAENALFSDPYYDSGQSLLVRTSDADTYSDLPSLAGKTIGVQTGTTGADYAEANKPDGATIKEYDEPAAMFLALQSKEIDAILQDLPVNAERAAKDDQFTLTGNFQTDEQYGFAARLDNTALIDAVNAQLQALRDDGTYDQIYSQYFAS